MKVVSVFCAWRELNVYLILLLFLMNSFPRNAYVICKYFLLHRGPNKGEISKVDLFHPILMHFFN